MRTHFDTYVLESNIVIHGNGNLLLRPKVAFRRLDIQCADGVPCRVNATE